MTPARVITHTGPALPIASRFAPFTEGMHTLSAAGDVTLFDVKRTELSAHGLLVEAGRELRKLRKRVGVG
ncbi:hypothetical protein [Asaia astilbis]|uniref:hypothetical protein n=1 Tax=Asaia astilbis TaxID=610244 RepID=UPI0018DBF93D|nr:hypothetical protein [Asaia astilbis]